MLDGGDRRSAIRLALRRARPGDVVAVLGKGHELGQEVGGAVLPFSDAEVVAAEWAAGADRVIALTVAEVAAVLGADLAGPGDPAARVTSVTADSRNIGPGALFVALPGARADGHDFVPTAYAAGAAAALTRRAGPRRAVPGGRRPAGRAGPAGPAPGRPGRRGGLRVVGITGSQGKTSTKDLLSQVLETAGPTVAPAGNLNNELGVPLTVSRIDEQTRYLVAEMGARGIGHIAYLCDIAPPPVGVVLNVGHAHVGEFGGQAAIAQAKGELVEALPADGRGGAERRRPAGLGHAGPDGRAGAGVLRRPPRARRTGPGGLGLRPGRRRLGRYAFRLHGAGAGPVRAEVRGRAAGGRPAPGRPTRSPRPAPRLPWGSTRRGRPPAWAPPPRGRAGGWSCTSAATG